MKLSYAFTLIEIIITAGLFVVISLLLSVMIVRGLNSFKFSRESIDAQEKMAQALRDFEKTSRGATEVLLSDPDEFTYYGYLLGDLQPAPSKIRYYCLDNSLIKGVTHPEGEGPVFSYPQGSEFSQMVIANVINCVSLFTYFNDTNGQIAVPIPIDAVKMAKLTIAVDKDPTVPPEAVSASTNVNFRNLKTNL